MVQPDQPGDRSPVLRLALCQLNPVVGDLVGNRAMLEDWTQKALAAGASVVVFPELAICGYPPEDLLLQRHFVEASHRHVERLAESFTDKVGIVGLPIRDDHLYNGLAVLHKGKIAATYRKILLPNYGVFDEDRYFEPGDTPAVIEIDGVRCGLSICEDIWRHDPVACNEAEAGAQLLLNISASPYHAGKAHQRESMLVKRAGDNQVAIAYCNAVGGQDELVFDGASMMLDAHGNVTARAAQFADEMLLCEYPPPDAPRIDEGSEQHDLEPQAAPAQPVQPVRELARVATQGDRWSGLSVCSQAPWLPSEEAEIYQALKLGLSDYVGKNGFPGVLLGLSGGIDSALVACIAADALGPDRVEAVVMPSPFNRPETQADAHTLAQSLGIKLRELAISPVMAAFDSVLKESFAETDPNEAEENIQARIRGALLMALSNKFGRMVVTTGNKSEMAVGYATLYGDMAGGFALIKDVSKTQVFALSRWRNDQQAGSGPIPETIISRPPSAELRPDQSDEESLGSYDLLDRIIELYIERDQDLEDIVEQGLPREMAERTVRLIDRAEYKRRQAPPGPRISVKAFGRDRRLPITARRNLR